MNRQTAVAFLLLLGCACISTNQAIRPGGDSGRIALKDRTSFQAELLALTSEDLYFVRDQQVWRAPLADVAGVRVEGYGLKTAKSVTLGVLGAADASLCVVLASGGCWQFSAFAIPLYVAGVWWSLSAGPRLRFRTPLDDYARCQLALYCRYPRSLTGEQWKELLSFYHQDGFVVPGGLPTP